MAPQAPPHRRYRLLTGLAISLALHAALLVAFRHQQPAWQADETPVSRTIAVWLRPAPAPEPAPAPPLAPPPEVRAPASAGQPAPRSRTLLRPPDLIALPAPSPGQAEPDDAFPVAPAAEPGPSQRVDREAALRVAREVASAPDPSREGTAVGQIPPKPYASDTKMARAIASAKRRDCKDGLPGGLLGPLLLLLDKKDSGCEW